MTKVSVKGIIPSYTGKLVEGRLEKNTGNMDDKGFLFREDGLIEVPDCGEGLFVSGRDGVRKILRTGDGKVDFVCYDGEKVLAYVNSQSGYPAMYPLRPARIEKPIKAVLMDLDGTSVRSEEFWIWTVQETTARLLGNPGFEFEDSDIPFVSGHSVVEHLSHCIGKYCPDKTLEEARHAYFEIVHREMGAVLEGKGKMHSFVPTPGLKDFLLALKQRNIRIGLVTSGLYEKAQPEIVAAFRRLGMGDPTEFYDVIICAGYPIGRGRFGTLGELEAKPHPWLYAETARVGLGIEFADRHRVIGIEDSGAGVVSIRLAGFSVIGFAGGNIRESGTEALCSHYCNTLEEILDLIT